MRAIFSILFWLGALLGASAQYVDSIFVEIPKSVLPLLEKNDRLNLLDFYDAGATSNVRNKLNGVSSIAYKDSFQIDLQLTEGTLLQLRAFPQKGAILILTRHTSNYIYGELAAYALADWQRVDIPIQMPSLANFLKEDISLEAADLQRAYRHLEQEASIYYLLKPADDALYARLSYSTLTQEEQALIRPYIREEIRLSMSILQ